MAIKARYIIRMADGELFPFYAEWLKIPGMVEYDPAIHGHREEVARQMGLVTPAPTVIPEVKAPESKAGKKDRPSTVASEPKKAQAQPPEPDLSDVFAQK